MYEHASVVSINDNGMVTVSCDSVACESCQAGALCNTKGKFFVAGNDTNIKLSIGDTVELYLPPGKTILAGFMALMLPLLLFPLGYYLTLAFKADATEIVRVLFGVVGIAFGFLITNIFSRLKAKEYTPQITRVLSEIE